MEEDIKLNKKEIFEALYILCTKNKNHTYGSIPYERIFEQLVDYIEELEKGYRELEVITNGIKVLETNGGNDETFYVIAKTDFLRGSYNHLLDDYIPKSKIKVKIQELTNMKDTSITSEGYNILNGEIVVLQELMEDK